MSDNVISVYEQSGYRLIINRAWCKGCELCVKSCPRQILYLDEEAKVGVSDIDKCIFCRLCELRCPDFAIRVEKGPSAAAKELETEAEAKVGLGCRLREG
jgi:2-oxoglutarate ferredoxin oxidoreductase subunit delta